MSGGNRKNANEALITALAGGSKIEDAAREAGISESTAYRRLRDPDFRKKVADARAEMVSQAIGRLTLASTGATVTLIKLLAEPTPPAVRLGAARSILELGAKLRESEELEQRVAALEESMAQEADRKAGQ